MTSGRIPTVAKNSRTAVGMTMVTSRFSPRRSVSRTSDAASAAVARGNGAGRLTFRRRWASCHGLDSPIAGELEVALLECRGPRAQLQDRDVVGRGPRGDRGGEPRLRIGAGDRRRG